MEWRWRLVDPSEAASARSAFVAFLRALCVPKTDYWASEMVFGELVANAITHAPGPVDIRVYQRGRLVMLALDDTNDDLVDAPPLPAPHSLSGRGLFIVSALCSSLRWTPLPRGKRVTVTLPVLARAAASGTM